MPPAHQRLHADDAVIARVHLRLIVHDELPCVDGGVKLALQREAFGGQRAEFAVVELLGIAAALLGAPHRRMGVLQKRL